MTRDDLEQACKAVDAAQSAFNMANSGLEIDAAIFDLAAAELRLRSLLLQARQERSA